jgi:hypothetical protein
MVRAWSQQEVEAIVKDYLSMLVLELKGVPFNKTEHRRQLLDTLNKRTNGSIELKHQNISAILVALNCPYISGYKPLGNYQRLLMDIVLQHVEKPILRTLLSEAVDFPITPQIPNHPLQKVAVPVRAKQIKYQVRSKKAGRSASGIPNYVEQEARNAALGLAGETAALEFERTRLREAGKDSLADGIEHVAITDGPQAGFDIRSYEIDGKDRFIEVKTTASGAYTPFFVTGYELETSNRHQLVYHLYRIFQFRLSPQFFMLKGRLEKSCRLEPVQYRARI